jgi:predicted Zn-dependent peptidase
MINRAIPPQPEAIDAISFLPAEVFQLANGARLHRMVHHAQPIVRLEVVLKAGKWQEPAPGISLLTSKMLLEGTANYSAKKLADIIALYGASVECQHGYDRMTLTLYCLTKHLTALLPLVEEILAAPAFPEEEFDLLQKRSIQNIKVEKQKPSYLATERFTANVYGQGHPYNSGASEDDIAKITTSTVKQFHSEAYVFSTAEVFACGDIDDEAALSIQNCFSKLRGNQDKQAGRTRTKEAGLREDYIRLPDSLQSAIRYGCIWPQQTHADYHKLNILNKVLGGYFGSRLMKNIREDKGFTYGIYSALSPKEHSNLFFIGTDVNYKSTGETLKEIKKEISILKSDLIPQEELELVKKYTIGKFIGDMNTIFEQCDKYKNLVFNSLSPSFYNNFLLTARTVTAEEVRDKANIYWNDSEFFEVVAGRKGED